MPLRLGAAKKEAGRAYHLVDIRLPKPDEEVTTETFVFNLRRDKLRAVRRREGRYLLRSNLTGEDPATLWRYYMQLTEVEQAFKELKHDLAVRPIFHQHDRRIEAHIFVAFLAYCLQVTLKNLARQHAPGLTPRAVLGEVRHPADGGRPPANDRWPSPGPAAAHATDPRSPSAAPTTGPATA